MKKTDKPKKNQPKTEKKPRKINPKSLENLKKFKSGDPNRPKGGRPKDSKDFSTLLNEVSNGEGKKELVKQVWIGIQEGRADMIKIALEYIFEKPKQTVENINHEPLKVIVENETLKKKIEDNL
jgi:hypothetical protein